MLSLRHWIGRICRCENGSQILEFAIVLPVLTMLLTGILEYSLIMYGSAVLEGATIMAAREGKTNYVNSTGTGACSGYSSANRTQYINCLVQYHTGGLLSSSQLQISIQDFGSTFGTSDGPVYTSCSNSGGGPLPSCTEQPGASGDIVMYTVQYPWTIVTPGLSLFLGSEYTLQSNALVKNEPF